MNVIPCAYSTENYQILFNHLGSVKETYTAIRIQYMQIRTKVYYFLTVFFRYETDKSSMFVTGAS